MSSDQIKEFEKHLKENDIRLDVLEGPDFNKLYEEFKRANEGHQHYDETTNQYICDGGYERNTTGQCVLVQQVPPVPVPTPTPLPIPPPTGHILYDSNVNGLWNNGIARIVKTKEGDCRPNGLGFYTAASGNPEAHIDGKGVLTLVTQPGFGRIYFAICNYNASVQYEFNIKSGSVDNLSDKWRNRHQMGGSCDNRPGGLGGHTSLTGCGIKSEKCHNIQGKGTDVTFKKKLSLNTWYKSKYDFFDTPDGKAIQQVRFLDYNDGNGWIKVLDHIEKNPYPSFMIKAAFEKQSEGWLRLNGSGEVSVRNMQVLAL